MYVIAIYDVGSKRDPKVMKIMKKYIFRKQNSVFEGELTPSQLDALKSELKKIKFEKDDSIIFYKCLSPKMITREAVTGTLGSDVLRYG